MWIAWQLQISYLRVEKWLLQGTVIIFASEGYYLEKMFVP